MTAQSGPLLTVVLFSVAAPFLARSLPLIVEPPSSEIDARARKFPTMVLPVPIVTEVSALHHTLQVSPPLTVISGSESIVEADLKIQIPEPLSTRSPVMMKASGQEIPGPRGESRE